MNKENDYLVEMELFSRHILGTNKVTVSPQMLAIYKEAVTSATVPEAQTRMIDNIKRHPWQLPYLDAYMALFDSSSELRRRIYITFSILETSTEYSESFIPENTSILKVVGVIGSSIRSILRLAGGILIARLMQWQK